MADNTELVEIRTSLPRAGRPPHDFRSIWSSTDEGTCKLDCEKKDVCSKFRMFIAGLETGKSSQEREHTERIERKHQDLKKDLYSTSFSPMKKSHWSMSFAMKRKTRSRKVFLKPYSP